MKQKGILSGVEQRGFLMVFSWLVLGGGLAAAQPQNSVPVRLAIDPGQQKLVVGGSVQVEVGLRGPSNEPTVTSKDLNVQVDVYEDGSASPVPIPVTIKAGTSSAKVGIPATRPGLIQLRAGQRELRPGSTFLLAQPSSDRPGSTPKTSIGPSPTTTTTFRPPTPATGATKPALPAAGKVDLSTHPSSKLDGKPEGLKSVSSIKSASAKLTVDAHSAGVAPVPSAPVASLPAAAAPTPNAVLSLSCGAEQPLANGREAVALGAMWMGGGEGPTEDIQVFYSVQGGALAPDPLVLPKGQLRSAASITSRNAGVVTVSRLSVRPEVRVTGDDPLTVEFLSPIVRQEVIVPCRVGLMEEATITVRLLDEAGMQVSTNKPRQFQLHRKSGHGTIEEENLTIAANASAVSTRFHPNSPGPVEIGLTSAQLWDQQVTFQVTWPWLLLILSCLGGLAGGLVASWVHKKEVLSHRLVIGLLAAFVLYWAAIYLKTTDAIPRNIAINPLSALAISILGGWMGTEVFSQVLKFLKWTGALK